MWLRKRKDQIQKCQLFLKKGTYGGCQSCPHSPRSVPTNFVANSEYELIHDTSLRAEPLSSGRNRNLSMPIQKLAHSSQRRGVGNMPKPLEGAHELLLTHQELPGSGGGNKTLRRLEHIVLQRQEEGARNDSSFGDRRPSGVYQFQPSSRGVQRQAQRTSEETERSQEPLRQEQRQSQLAQTLPTRVQDSQIGAFSRGQCAQSVQDSYEIYSQGVGKDEEKISMKIIDEIHLVQSHIDVNIGKLDAKLTKMTLDINDLKKNNKQFSEIHKCVITTLEFLTNTCDRIESKYQAQIDEMEDLYISNINDQLKILKDHVLEIAENTNQLTTHLAKSDSDRQKLKNGIIANVEQIYKN
ncbi:hypothetical protein O181_095036 [Austropuccinia psidii MF-1]|uniref:Uncharacterized protein n=1 Tax=Austropuccinia psidii MF-1 TaxID=1389203 RepID=A0A9Q3PCX5_9BASI|nr:hypothetical protein [Austropuccinia psidii MF-1]